MTFYSVSAVIGYAAGYKRLKKYNNNNNINRLRINLVKNRFVSPVIRVCLVAKTVLFHHFFYFNNFSFQQNPFITQQSNVTIGQKNARMC